MQFDALDQAADQPLALWVKARSAFSYVAKPVPSEPRDSSLHKHPRAALVMAADCRVAIGVRVHIANHRRLPSRILDLKFR
jgi:hypothetical protein